MTRFLGIPLLIVATFLTITACAGKSSSNASDQSNATASTASQATAAAPSPTATTPDSVYGAPVFPGAVVQPASIVNLNGTQTTVLSSDDTFDEVRAWYEEHIPTELSRSTGGIAGGMSGAVFLAGTGKHRVKVSIAPSDKYSGYTIITYTRGAM
jgi:hypothetical protein